MNAYWKDILREIKNTLGRFISLIVITALGVASVTGIQATAIDMRSVADKMYKQTNLYDIQLKSTTGFDDDDIQTLQSIENIRYIMPAYIFDVFIFFQDEMRTIRTYSLPNRMNQIELLDGQLPQNDRECAVEESVLRRGGYKIGDTISLGLDDMDDYYKVFDNSEFTIVGVVSSPLYIGSHERGNTSLGDGSLAHYMYLHPSAYNIDVYTDVYVSMEASQNMDNLTDDYSKAAEEWKESIKIYGDALVQSKKDELANAQKKIDDGWVEYDNAYQELNEKVIEGLVELNEAKVKLDDAETQLIEAQITLEEKINEALSEIEAKRQEIQEGQSEIYVSQTLLEDAQNEIDENRNLLTESLAQLEAVAPYGVSETLDAQYRQIQAAMNLLEANQAELNAGVLSLEEAKGKIIEGTKQIEDAEETLEQERIKAQEEIDSGWIEYYKGLSEYNSGMRNLFTEQANAQNELQEAFSELEEAQRKLDDAPTPEWYYFTRKDGLSFDSYYQDTLRLQKIGYVFPLVFYLVAIMVSLTTMSRMVEEHRTQIGVYKALGYKSSKIIAKYMFYAFGAGITGGVAGVLVGSNVFPRIIADAYGHMYDMPPVETPIPLFISFIAVISAVGAVGLVTLITCLSSMADVPAALMRPKSPPEGKRVLIEKIPFIWNRLGFIGKVTARNIFRYKRRFIMTLFGIAGCSALLLTAFGLRDSIGGVGELQYEKIVKYNVKAYVREITTDKQRDDFDSLISGDYLYIREESAEAKNNAKGFSMSIIIPEKADKLNNFINLYSPKTGDVLPFTDNSILISEKLARELDVSENGTLEITLNSGRSYNIQITGIVENYIFHYIYMSSEIYEELFDEEVLFNSIFSIADNEQELATSLLSNENVRTVINVADAKVNITESTDALSVVTIVLIVLACALALVVLFNLTNINITERIRELATIKVLGFYESELAMYIYRENGAVTALGIALGLGLGVLLHKFVLVSAEIDLLMFPHIISPQSYVIAIILSVVFAVFVNFIMNFKLAKIDMVESLKNIE